MITNKGGWQSQQFKEINNSVKPLFNSLANIEPIINPLDSITPI